MKTSVGNHIYTGRQYSAMALAVQAFEQYKASHPEADREAFMAGYFTVVRGFVSAK